MCVYILIIFYAILFVTSKLKYLFGNIVSTIMYDFVYLGVIAYRLVI